MFPDRVPRKKQEEKYNETGPIFLAVNVPSPEALRPRCPYEMRCLFLLISGLSPNSSAVPLVRPKDVRQNHSVITFTEYLTLAIPVRQSAWHVLLSSNCQVAQTGRHAAGGFFGPWFRVTRSELSTAVKSDSRLPKTYLHLIKKNQSRFTALEGRYQPVLCCGQPFRF